MLFHLTTSNGYYCSSHTLIYINYIFDCVAAVGSWTMTEEGKFCRETIAEDFKDGLVVCEAYCEENGAKTLSFNTVANTNYDQYYCRCCTESSELKDASCYEHSCNQMYTLLGKYMYLASTNWFRNIWWLLIEISNPAKTLHIYYYRLIWSKSNYLVYVAAHDQTTITI